MVEVPGLGLPLVLALAARHCPRRAPSSVPFAADELQGVTYMEEGAGARGRGGRGAAPPAVLPGAEGVEATSASEPLVLTEDTDGPGGAARACACVTA